MLFPKNVSLPPFKYVFILSDEGSSRVETGVSGGENSVSQKSLEEKMPDCRLRRRESNVRRDTFHPNHFLSILELITFIKFSTVSLFNCFTFSIVQLFNCQTFFFLRQKIDDDDDLLWLLHSATMTFVSISCDPLTGLSLITSSEG